MRAPPPAKANCTSTYLRKNTPFCTYGVGGFQPNPKKTYDVLLPLLYIIYVLII